ncbi:hypothetical protein SCACP_30600 [Sporomusa carbonis]
MKMHCIEEVDCFLREFAKLNLMLVEECSQDSRKITAELLRELRENAQFLHSLRIFRG